MRVQGCATESSAGHPAAPLTLYFGRLAKDVHTDNSILQGLFLHSDLATTERYMGRFSTNARDDLKMSYKTDHRIEGFYDYVVPPLEGFWWQDGIDGNPAGKTQKPGRHGRAHSNGILFASDPSIIGIDGADEYRRFEEIGAASISFSCESTEIGLQLPIY